jgi:hypothetical protein
MPLKPHRAQACSDPPQHGNAVDVLAGYYIAPGAQPFCPPDRRQGTGSTNRRASFRMVRGCFTITTSDGPLRLTGLTDFVTVPGGYFFMPSKTTIRFLASER